MTPTDARNPIVVTTEKVGRAAVAGVEEIGLGAMMVVESFYWLIFGRREKQAVRLGAIAEQCMAIGIQAVPIIALLAATIGMMLAIQGIHTLRIFGAESRVTVGISFSVVR